MAKTKNIQEPIEEINTISDININQIIPNVIDNFLVTIFEGHHTIFLPLNITGTQFRNWYKGKGGVYSKDVLNVSLNRPAGKYVQIKSKEFNCIVRLISEEEELNFKTLKLVDGQIKDRPYMILKNIKDGEGLTSTLRYLAEKEATEEDTIFMVASNKITQEDDINHHIGSISLFTE